MVSEHGQTGPALTVYVHGVDRHDDSLWTAVVRHQDADPAVAEADGVVCHPGGKETLMTWVGEGARQRSGIRVQVSPGSSVLVQVDPASRTDRLWPDPNRHGVKCNLGAVLLHPRAEGGSQGEWGVGVDLSEVGVHTGT